MISLAILVFGTWLTISFVTFSPGYKSRVHHRYNEPRTKTNWNAIALILNVYDYIIGVNWKDVFYPKSGIDKEIAEEEKEIAELERQKEKMERLSELKRRKERLFNDVGDTLKREELNSDIAVSFSGNKNRLDVEFISGWHKVYYSHAYNLDEIKQAIYDGKPIIEEDVRL